MKKIILHLCADIGSDSFPYQCDENYKVIKIGKEIGVENVRVICGNVYVDDFPPFHKNKIAGIIANPPCIEFSTARSTGKAREGSIGFKLVDHCMRIIKECKPVWWALENPARGTLKNYLGKPKYTYEPWEYGSPWTKRTALWGDFNIPQKQYINWETVPKNGELYIRPGRPKPGFAFLHKSAIHNIPEFKPFIPFVKTDNCFRSLCSQGFAKAFKEVNQ